MDKIVFGCLNIVVACDADVVCQEAVGQNPNNRSTMGVPRQKEWHAHHRPGGDTLRGRGKQTREFLGDAKKSITNSKTRLSSKKCAVDVVEARTRSFMVVRDVGEKLGSRLQPVELVEALPDAIKVRRVQDVNIIC